MYKIFPKEDFLEADLCWVFEKSADYQWLKHSITPITNTRLRSIETLERFTIYRSSMDPRIGIVPHLCIRLISVASTHSIFMGKIQYYHKSFTPQNYVQSQKYGLSTDFEKYQLSYRNKKVHREFCELLLFHDYISAISPILARFSNSIFPKRNVKPALIERLFTTLFVLDDM